MVFPQPRHVFILLLIGLQSAAAGDNPRQVTAVRTGVSPVIDGVPGEPEWSAARPATDFTQRDPEDGKPASEASEIRVLYDNQALYFGCRYYDSEPSGIVSRLARRDNETESDMASIRIDSFHDSRTAFEFTFNVSGVKVDIIQYDDGDREDDSWDAVWDVQTRITDEGWEAEIRIPFSVLRYHAAEGDTAGQVWGINFTRYITRKKESAWWAHVPKNESGFVSRFGHLLGLRGIPAPHRVEVLPFGLLRQSWSPATNVMDRKSAFVMDGGVDLKIGLGNSLTIDATVNPDFGQVEADPAVLNLSTFETFYPEKRPFFIEGMQIIRFATFGDDNGPGMFYSRRIGRGIDPDEAGAEEDERVESIPQHVSILGAAKLSGRLTNTTSIGILQAVTRREYATVREPGQMARERLVEPESHYNVIRIKQDVLGGSSVGGILTSVARKAEAPALTAGLDWDLRLWEATHRLDGFLALSHTSDAAGQRVSGGAGRVHLARSAAVHWLWSASVDFTTPRYDINDVGFFRRPNDYGGFATLTYKEDQPAAVVRSYDIEAQAHERWNFDGAQLNRNLGLDINVLFSNYWETGVEFAVDFGQYDDRETRGNGLYRKPTSSVLELYGETDDRRVLALGAGYRTEWDAHGKREQSIEAVLEYRPLPWMEWTFETEFETIRGEEAWVTNTLLGGRTVSLFGDRNTDMANFTVRGEVTFTRDLTLQVYGQLFLAKGYTGSLRTMVAPGSFGTWPDDILPAGFNEHELHTNAVLRWEYVPGSTLYLVWSQAREGTGQKAHTVLGEDVADAFRLAPSNVLLLKVTYWWNM
jgi:hypothetical protein